MALSKREQVIMTGFALAVLFGILGMTLGKQLNTKKELRDRLTMLQNQRKSERLLIDSAPVWAARYEQMRDQMPVFPPGQDVQTHWQGRMDKLAANFQVKILRRQSAKEVALGDVYEFPIECREWEATLEDFLRFLHAMQLEGAMLDVRHLRIRPLPTRPGVLGGSFTLYCAFMRAAADTPQE